MPSFLSMSPIVRAILALLPLLLPGGANAGVAYKVFNANINADVLVLDSGSLTFPGNHPIRPLVASASDCRDDCNKLAGCNAYTYCGKKSGCGSGCPAYVKQHPTLQTTSTSLDISPDTKLPILAFGPFASLCSGDAWPQGLCSLKSTATPSKPKFFSNNPADGWVSGTIIMPTKCKGVPANTCKACLKASDQDGCLSCAKSVPDQRLQQAKGETGLLVNGCAPCYTGTTGAKRTRCLGCLLGKQPCSECAVRASKPHSVGLCLDCYLAEPAKAQASCLSCASMNNPKLAKQCATECLPRLRNTWCTKQQEDAFGNRRANCTKSYSTACTTCSGSAAYSTCLKCLVKWPGSNDCESCTTVDKAKQSKCFGCALKTYSEFSPCADCLNFGNQQCLGCVKDPKVPYEGKGWCMGCGNWYDTSTKQQQCYGCLKQKHTDLFATCSRL